MFMRFFLLCLITTIFFSCQEKQLQTLKQGTYRAELQVDNDNVLPFIFKVDDANHIRVFNAEEIIVVDEITYVNDSVFIKMPVFEGIIAAKINDTDLSGRFIKPSLNRVVPFKATLNTLRFDNKNQAQVDVSGQWETTFSPNTSADKYIAKGVFNQTGNQVTGTFRTTTGDYRFLEGIVDGNTLKLSTFDGAHAFLFTASVTDSTMNGTFYSGNHWKEPFVAKLNANYELPSANELTFLKAGYDKLEFSFPNAAGEMISLDDSRFKNKVVLVQIMGTWCPNCLDESKYYSAFFKANRDKDIEIIALAFEYVKTKAQAFNNIKRLQERIGIDYPIVLAQTGTSSKIKAQEKLPMLNHVLSYPTTIFIDKTGRVRKIHTGFNGPATGAKYVAFKNEFEGFINTLLSE